MTFQGINTITTKYPKYDWSSVIPEVRATGMLDSDECLPKSVGGRAVDILIGLKSPELQPRFLFTLPSGLGVYRCRIPDVHGSTIAFGGPSSVITKINSQFNNFNVNHMSVFFSRLAASQMQVPWVGPDIEVPPRQLPLVFHPSKHQSTLFDSTPLTPDDLTGCGLFNGYSMTLVPPEICPHQEARRLLQLNAAMVTDNAINPEGSDHAAPPGSVMEDCPPYDSEVEQSNRPKATEQDHASPVLQAHKALVPLAKLKSIMEDDSENIISYRCPDCEDCPKCKASPVLQSSSLRERTEQKLIESSVRIDYSQSKVFVRFPFTMDPIPFFKKHFGPSGSNYDQARATYMQQCRKKEIDKLGIRAEIGKLHELGFISALSDLPAEVQDVISRAPVTHYFPWRSVSKPDSLTTPTRLVVDPSMSLLNLIVAKGDPQLSSMFSILVRSRAKSFMWSADVTKLYNMLYLEPEHFPFSLFLYHSSLDPAIEPQVFIMLRAWYGTVSVAAQATVAIRRLGSDHLDTHPLGARVLINDSYVDDLLPSTESRGIADVQESEVHEILARGGMKLKFTLHSNEPPPEIASSDGVSVTVLGYRYMPEEDVYSLNLPEINFQKKSRGAKPPNTGPAGTPSEIEELMHGLKKITRRHIVAKAAEVFDPLGLYEPYKAMLKRALSALNSLDWNDEIYESEVPFWTTSLKAWPEISAIKLPRSLVPSNAIEPHQIRLICNTDASQTCAGACVYLSYKLKCGKWSSKLLTAKSRLLNGSVPRNEMDAIVLGVELVFAVVVSLGMPLESVLIASDSLVAICWAMNERSRHKTFIFNRCLTIRRYLRWIASALPASSQIELVHIPGQLNLADCLTKGTILPKDLSEDSPWQNGLPWMSLELSDMPLTRFSDISLSKDEVAKYLAETLNVDQTFSPDPCTDAVNFCLYPTINVCGESMAVLTNPDDLRSEPPSSPAVSVFLSSVFSGQTQSLLEKENYQFRKFDKNITHLVNVITLGWDHANKILSNVVEFAAKLFHNTHEKTKKEDVKKSMSQRCLICKIFASLDDKNLTIVSPVEQEPPVDMSESVVLHVTSVAVHTVVNHYWNLRSTILCLAELTPKERQSYIIDKDTGILFYKARIGKDSKVSVVDLELLNLAFLDSAEVNFCNPCILPQSSIFYAYVMAVHWKLLPHFGLESTLLEISKRFHPIRPRKILARILSDCIKCKLIQKKVLAHEMSQHNSVRLTLAPPFTFVMIDLAQNFRVKTRFQGRQTQKSPALVVCCLLSGATAIYMLEDWSTPSVIQGLERHGCRHGFPTQIFIDAGSQLRQLSSVSYSVMELSTSIRNRFFCQIVQSPPKSHSSQGRVERKIRLIKDMLEKLAGTDTLMSFLNWETLFCKVSNDINNLPISRPSATSETRPEWSVITPNRLLLGRNNKRSLVGPLVLESNPSTILERVNQAQEAWYGLFLKQLHLFVPRPKWTKTDEVSIDDVVMFFIDESSLKKRSMVWHYGLVTAVEGQRLQITYTLPPSTARKCIQRSKRDVVRIASESELDSNTEKHAAKMVL